MSVSRRAVEGNPFHAALGIRVVVLRGGRFVGKTPKKGKLLADKKTGQGGKPR
jgi:hypothetical protein